MLDIDIIRNQICTAMAAQAERLFEHMLALMAQDLEAGWRAFYARELWFARHLPAPLINAAGRAYMVEQLRAAICSPPSQECSVPPPSGQGYRNYLAPGPLSLEGWSAAPAWDQVADQVVLQKLEEAQQHMLFEVQSQQENWYAEALQKATLAPPQMGVLNDDVTPVRNPALPLRNDGHYWRAVYPVRWSMVMHADDYPALVKPEWTLKLMRHLAPDFPYAAEMSTTKRLVFVRQGERQLAWALMIDKTGGSTDFRYPPQLILIERQHRRKLRDEHIIFQNVIGKQFPSFAKGPQGLETELLFHLPRCRKLVDIYQSSLAHLKLAS